MTFGHEKRILQRHRQGQQDRVADAITKFAGSMLFIYLHIIWFGLWIVVNVVYRKSGFDPFPFGLLTLVVSLEAIFLSTFVMLSQNRDAQRSDIRADLDFATNVRAEVWIEALADKLGVDVAAVRAAAEEKLAQMKAAENS
jgi:uncharacterized membrane protein